MQTLDLQLRELKLGNSTRVPHLELVGMSASLGQSP